MEMRCVLKCQNSQNSLPVEWQVQHLFFVIISKDIFGFYFIIMFRQNESSYVPRGDLLIRQLAGISVDKKFCS